MKTKSGKRFITYAIPVIRIIIGMAFFLAGLAKIIDLRGFQEVIEAFGLFSIPLPLIISIMIPVLEIILGLMLLLGVYIRIAAIHINVLVVIFSWLTFFILRNRPDMLCGCFGGFLDMTFNIYHLIVLFIIFILNLFIVIEPSDTWTIQKVFREKISEAKKMLIVEIITYIVIAVGIILIGFAIYMNFWGSQNDASAQETVVEEIVQPGVINITVDEAYDAYLSDEGFVFVDVRSKPEYDSGHIKGAVLIPISELEERIGELQKDKPILVYCNGSACQRSGNAASILVSHGFTKVYDLIGNGIDEWISKGYPSE